MNSNLDPIEAKEWLDSFDAVNRFNGNNVSSELIQRLTDHAREQGVTLPAAITTPFKNTINPEDERVMPGDLFMERRIRSLIRWNAMAMVVRANTNTPGIGGHISTYASSSNLYEVAFNHFFKGPDHPDGGDLIFFQGHGSPGQYARAFLEGRLTEKNLENFRRELTPGGLSSYPHPYLMPEFWQFATVSMGLGPIMAIYQARFLGYISDRGIVEKSDRKVWAFLGDGEMDT